MSNLTFRLASQYFIGLIFLLAYVYLVYDYSINNHWSVLSFLIVLGALYLADALSGVIHFYLDYRPCPSGVGLKELFFYTGNKGSAEYIALRRKTMTRVNAFEELVFDFKIHHPSPDTLGRRGLIKLTLGAVVFAGFPVSLVLVALTYFDLMNAHLMLFCLVLIGAIVISQYAHSCAHKKTVPFIPMLLQKSYLFITTERHDVHHRTLDRDFCTLNGWANVLVNIIFNIFNKYNLIDKSGLEPK